MFITAHKLNTHVFSFCHVNPVLIGNSNNNVINLSVIFPFYIYETSRGIFVSIHGKTFALGYFISLATLNGFSWYYCTRVAVANILLSPKF